MNKHYEKGENMSNNKKDTQSNKYLLTVNNPLDHDCSHENILSIFQNNFKTLQYLCMADEQGSTYHTHIFVCFSSRVRFSMIKKHFPKARIDTVRGSVSDNVFYIKKSGKWANDEKHGTKIEGTFEEFGQPPPDSNGSRHDMTELYNMINDGFSNAEILQQNQDYILHIDKLDKLRTLLLTEKYKGERRLDISVTYRYGATGTFKTRKVLDDFGDTDVFRITDYEHPFDSYSCQPCIVFEEFRNSLPIKEMLNYLDIYPIELPARYTNKFACYNHVYLISNWSLEMQYQAIQKDDKDTWKAFLRRIKKVEVFTQDGIIVYDSTEAYFNRDSEFKAITKDEQLLLPFELLS